MSEESAPDIEAGDDSAPFTRHTKIRALSSIVLSSRPIRWILGPIGLSPLGNLSQSEYSPSREPEQLFQKKDGQALLLAFNLARNGDATAMKIPVYRPSAKWASKMARLEREGKPLPVNLPPTSGRIARSKEIRDEYSESEVEIWKRIKHSYQKQLAWWYFISPFWRPKLEEREITIHSRRGDKFTVEVKEPLNVEKLRRQTKDRLAEAKASFKIFSKTEDSCDGTFDTNGRWHASYHAQWCLDEQDDSKLQPKECPMEQYKESTERLKLMERHTDFMKCYKHPHRAKTVFPLTTGRLQHGCIYDQNDIAKMRLPDSSRPNELPPSIRGIYIEYHFDMERYEWERVLVGSFVILVVLGWKLATDEWSTAAAFGSLLIGLLGWAASRTPANKREGKLKGD